MATASDKAFAYGLAENYWDSWLNLDHQYKMSQYLM